MFQVSSNPRKKKGVAILGDALPPGEVLCRSSWPICELCGQKVKDLAAHLSAESGAHMALMLQNLTAMRQEMTDLKAENRQLQERLLGEPGREPG